MQLVVAAQSGQNWCGVFCYVTTPTCYCQTMGVLTAAEGEGSLHERATLLGGTSLYPNLPMFLLNPAN